MSHGLQHALAATHGVALGQRWVDPKTPKGHPRSVDRFRVSERWGWLMVQCVVLETGRKVSIRVDKFPRDYMRVL